jgi:hypothetical protein
MILVFIPAALNFLYPQPTTKGKPNGHGQPWEPKLLANRRAVAGQLDLDDDDGDFTQAAGPAAKLRSRRHSAECADQIYKKAAARDPGNWPHWFGTATPVQTVYWESGARSYREISDGF